MHVTPPLTSPEAWHDFIVNNADCYSAVRYRPFLRRDGRTLTEARAYAKLEGGGPWLIYAIYGTHDTVVETIHEPDDVPPRRK